MDMSINYVTKQFLKLVTLFEFNHVSCFTHKLGHTLDLVLSKSSDVVITPVLDAISDHYCIFFNLCCEQSKTNKLVQKHYINENTAGIFIQRYSQYTLPPYLPVVNGFLCYFI